MKKPSTNTRGLIEKGQKNTSTARVKSNNKSTFKCFINMQEEILVLILSGEGGAVTDDPERAEVTVLFFLLQPSLKRSAGNRWPTTAGTGAEPQMTTLLPGISPRDFSQGFHGVLAKLVPGAAKHPQLLSQDLHPQHCNGPFWLPSQSARQDTQDVLQVPLPKIWDDLLSQKKLTWNGRQENKMELNILLPFQRWNKASKGKNS